MRLRLRPPLHSPSDAPSREWPASFRRRFETMRLIAMITIVCCIPLFAQDGNRPRAREAGVVVGILPPGPVNAITDIPGVAVGQKTMVQSDNISNGVTAILPHTGHL